MKEKVLGGIEKRKSRKNTRKNKKEGGEKRRKKIQGGRKKRGDVSKNIRRI